MIVLEVNSFLRNKICFESFGGVKCHRYLSVIAPKLVSVSMILFTVWTYLNFIWNVNDNFLEALFSMQTATAFVMVTTLHASFLINRANFYLLFEDMQTIVNDSTYEPCVLN